MKERFSKLKEKIKFDEEKFMDKTKDLTKTVASKSTDAMKNVSAKSKEIYDNRDEISKNILDKSKEIGSQITTQTKKATGIISDKSKEASDNIKSVDLFHSKIRQKSLDEYNELVEEYEKTATIFGEEATKLYEIREEAIKLVKLAEAHINQLANTPKEFQTELKRINTEVMTFESKRKEIQQAEKEAKIAAAGSGTGATLSALGLAVATMGPSAAMGIATTFGVASTGTAISSLTGAAATNAALAWLGGGALVAGGGGITKGSALLALAGPVGWTIAGVALTTSVGTGLYASNKNKEIAEELIDERKNLANIKRKFEGKTYEIKSLHQVTNTQMIGLEITNKQVIKTDYSTFNDEEKLTAGVLVNSTLSLAELINKELSLDE